MRTLLPIDELNRIKEMLVVSQYETDGKPKYNLDKDRFIDAVYEMLVMAFVYGTESANADLKTAYKFSREEQRTEIDKIIAGKTWRERVAEYLDNGGSVDEIMRVAETESHRVVNDGIIAVGNKAEQSETLEPVDLKGISKQNAQTTPLKGIFKTWHTMLDDKVRDEHVELEGQKIPLKSKFSTWDGFLTDRPGMFGVPELDINCRCFLTLSRG